MKPRMQKRGLKAGIVLSRHVRGRSMNETWLLYSASGSVMVARVLGVKLGARLIGVQKPLISAAVNWFAPVITAHKGWKPCFTVRCPREKCWRFASGLDGTAVWWLSADKAAENILKSYPYYERVCWARRKTTASSFNTFDVDLPNVMNLAIQRCCCNTPRRVVSDHLAWLIRY